MYRQGQEEVCGRTVPVVPRLPARNQVGAGGRGRSLHRGEGRDEDDEAKECCPHVVRGWVGEVGGAGPRGRRGHFIPLLRPGPRGGISQEGVTKCHRPGRALARQRGAGEGPPGVGSCAARVPRGGRRRTDGGVHVQYPSQICWIWFRARCASRASDRGCVASFIEAVLDVRYIIELGSSIWVETCVNARFKTSTVVYSA